MNIKTFMVAAVAALTLAACAAEKEEELVATDEAVAETVTNDEVTAEATPAPEATEEAAQ